MKKAIDPKRCIAAALLLFLSGCATSAGKPVIRVAHLPNVTHAQAVIAHGNGWFDGKLGPDAVVEWKIFNAGPSVIEAIFAGQIDIAYAGPSPAINGFIKSGGEALRVVGGAASGGAALVVRKDAGISSVGDLRNKKIASPQLGNTQDVALRSWLSKNNLTLKEKGGEVQVIPISNADQQTLFLKKDIDAAWTVEPWVSLLVENAGGRIFLEESSLWPGGQYATTLVLVRKNFLEKHPELVKKFLLAHAELTDWVNQNPSEAKKILSEELARETGKVLPSKVLDAAWKRIHFTTDPLESSIREQGRAAFQAGFLKKDPDLSALFERGILESKIEK